MHLLLVVAPSGCIDSNWGSVYQLNDLGCASESYNKQIREWRYVEPDNKVNEL